MRIPLLCLTVLFLISCKTREKPVPVTQDDRTPEKQFGYSIDTLESLNEYIPLLSHRKLRVEHYCYTIISHVNVVDVRTGTIVTDNTVVLHDKIIESILASGAPQPKIDAQYRILEIDGTGKYLAPGLCDMHVHYFCSNAMRLQFLVNGVTSVRNVDGGQLHRDEQQLISNQQLLGPNCYSTFTADSTPRLNDTSYHSRNVPPSWLCINEGFKAEQLRSGFAVAEKNQLRVSIDTWNALPEINYPDNTAFEQWTSIDMLQRRTNFSRFWFFSKFYTDSLRINVSSPISKMAWDVLRTAPGQFCIGTETQARVTTWETCPVVNEMKFLQAHQLPPIIILQIATRNGGKLVNAGVATDNKATGPAWFGEVQVGYRADLVLLGKNPLVDVGNYANPESVFVNGVYLGPSDLREMNNAVSKWK